MQKREPKEWTSLNEQLDVLVQRGLIIENKAKALGYLKTIGYYRLSGYLHSFRQLNPANNKSRLDNFIDGSCFEDVIHLYMFDKKLRYLALEALERIEIALRVNITHTLGRYSPTAHLQKRYFDDEREHDLWLDKYQKLIKRESRASMVKHHAAHYTDIPIWAGCEVWDFGAMSRLYKNMLTKDKDRIAKIYHLQEGRHLQTHLHAFNFIRNTSAHHGRLWNKSVIFQATLKGITDKEFKQLNVQQNFVYFCLMKRMLDVICPNSQWGERFLALLAEFPSVDNGAISLQQLGVVNDPSQWQLWQKSTTQS